MSTRVPHNPKDICYWFPLTSVSNDVGTVPSVEEKAGISILHTSECCPHSEKLGRVPKDFPIIQ